MPMLTSDSVGLAESVPVLRTTPTQKTTSKILYPHKKEMTQVDTQRQKSASTTSAYLRCTTSTHSHPYMVVLLFTLILPLVNALPPVTPVVLPSTTLMASTSLLLLTINMNSLVGADRRAHLDDLLRDTKADIVCVAETWLGLRHQRENLLSPMRVVFSTPTPCVRLGTRGGDKHKWGTLIGVAPHIPIIEEHNPGGNLAGRVAAVVVAIPGKDSTVKRILIVSVYGPASSTDRSDFLDALSSFLLAFTVDDMIVAGDWNINLDELSRDASRFMSTHHLNDAANPTPDVPLPIEDFYTYCDSAGRGRSRIDGLVTTATRAVTGFSTIDHEIHTPHRATLTTIDITTWTGGILQHIPTTRTQRLVVDMTDTTKKQKFQSMVAESLPEHVREFGSLPLDRRVTQLDAVAHTWQKEISHAAKIVYQKQERNYRRGTPPHIREACHQAKRVTYLVGLLFRISRAKENNTLHTDPRLQHTTLTLTNPTIPIPSEINMITVTEWFPHAALARKGRWKVVKDLQIAHREETRARMSEEKIQALSRRWRLRFYGHAGSTLPLMLTTTEGKTVSGAKDIAKTMRNHYDSLGKEKPRKFPMKPWMSTPSAAKIRQSTRPYTHIFASALTDEELDRAIKRSSTSSRPGPDQICYRIIRILPSDARNALFAIIDTILRGCVFPQAACDGLIFSIFKTGDPLQLSNYRGITLLNTLYKLSTSVMNERLGRVLRLSNTSSACQGGGRSGGQCVYQVATMLNCVTDAKQRKVELHDIANDIVKAFDGTTFRGFNDSAIFMGLGEHYQKFERALQHTGARTVCTAYGVTDPITLEKGCWQGDGLSPARFCLFLEPFFCWLEDMKIGYKFVISPTETLDIPANAFMDDVHLLSSSRANVITSFKMLVQYLAYYGMSLSQTKCRYTSNQSEPQPPLVINEALESFTLQHNGVDTTGRSLGFHLSLDETWTHNEKVTTQNVRAASMRCQGYADVHTTARLVKADVLTRWTYTAQLASFTPQGLRAIQNLILDPVRRNGRLPRTVGAVALYSLLKTPLLQPLHAAISLESLVKCLNSPNTHCSTTTRAILERATVKRYGTPLSLRMTGEAKHTPMYMKTGVKAAKKSKLTLIDTHPTKHFSDWTVQDAVDATHTKKIRGLGKILLSEISDIFVEEGGTSAPIDYMVLSRPPLHELWYNWHASILKRTLPRPLAEAKRQELSALIMAIVYTLVTDPVAPAHARASTRRRMTERTTWPSSHPLTRSAAEEQATDGSVKESRAAVAVTDGSRVWAQRVTDDTPTLKTELLAMWLACRSTTVSLPLIHVDCLSAINMVKEAWTATREGRWIDWGRVEHGALVHLLVEQCQQYAVFPFTHVKAHTQDQHHAARLNAQVDVAARTATSSPNQIQPGHPWAYGQRFVLWKRDRVLEGPLRAQIYDVLARETSTSHLRKTFPLLRPGTYEEQSLWPIREGQLEGRVISIAIKMWTRSLPTMHRLQRIYPDIYESSACPTCEGDETLEHFTQTCPTHDTTRTQLHEELTTYLQKEGRIPRETARQVITFAITSEDNKENRIIGRVRPGTLQLLLDAGSTATQATSLTRQISRLCAITCARMWYMRCDTMATKQLTYTDLLGNMLTRLQLSPEEEMEAIRLRRLNAGRKEVNDDLTLEDYEQEEEEQETEHQVQEEEEEEDEEELQPRTHHTYTHTIT